MAIIGAGPAGLFAALELARLGHDATVYENHREVGLPVRCGEALVDLYRMLDRDPPGVRVRVQELCVKLKDLHHFPAPDIGVWMLDKDKWLQSMAREAESQGVHVVLEAKARISHLRKESDFVLDCSGCPSQSSREYGIDCGTLGLAIQWTVRADVASRLGKLYFHFEPGEVGYRWVFPKSAREANVGIGWAKNPPSGKWATLREFVSRQFGDFEILRRTAGYLPSKIVRTPFVENVLLCGDAVGVVNPYSGAGTHMALLSGALAARCLDDGRPQFYCGRLMSATRGELKVAGFARSLLEASYSHHERALAYMERHFPLSQLFSEYTYRRLSPMVYIWKLRNLLVGAMPSAPTRAAGNAKPA